MAGTFIDWLPITVGRRAPAFARRTNTLSKINTPCQCCNNNNNHNHTKGKHKLNYFIKPAMCVGLGIWCLTSQSCWRIDWLIDWLDGVVAKLEGVAKPGHLCQLPLKISLACWLHSIILTGCIKCVSTPASALPLVWALSGLEHVVPILWLWHTSCSTSYPGCSFCSASFAGT